MSPPARLLISPPARLLMSPPARLRCLREQCSANPVPCQPFSVKTCNLVSFVGEGVGHLPAAQAAVEVGGAAGAAADLATGGARYRTGGSEQHVTNGDAVTHRDRGSDGVGDRCHLHLVRTWGALPHDDQLLG